MVQLQLRYEDERVKLATYRNLFVAGWNDAPRLPQMEAMTKLARVAQDEVGPMALSNVVYGGKPDFDNDVRVASANLNKDPSSFELGRAHILLLPGIAGVAVRAFLSTMMLMGRPQRPTRVFGDLDSGEAFLLQQLEGWTPEELSAAHAELARLTTAP